MLWGRGCAEDADWSQPVTGQDAGVGGETTDAGDAGQDTSFDFPDAEPPTCPSSLPDHGWGCHFPSTESCIYASGCSPNGCEARCVALDWFVNCAPCKGETPKCPAQAPVHGDPCSAPTGDYKCTYHDCLDGEFAWASCAEGVWSVSYVLCEPPPCPATNGEDPVGCPSNTLCVEPPHCSVGAADNCAVNPCQHQPLSCSCAGSLCGPYLECAKAGAGVVTCTVPFLDTVSWNQAGEPVAVAKNQKDAGNVTLAAGHVYWSADYNSSGGQILRVPLQGGTPEPIAETGSIVEVVAAGPSLIVADIYAGAILQVPLGGGEVTTLAAGLEYPKMLAANAEAVFFTSSGKKTLWSIPKSGGLPKEVAELEWPEALRADDAAVYWTESNPKRIRKLVAVVGEPETLAERALSPSSLAIDDDYLYWVERVGDLGSVVRIAKDGGTPQVLAEGQYWPGRIAVSTGFVYWSAGDELANGAGKLHRVPAAGGAVETLAAGIGWPSSIAADGTHVYWTTGGFWCGSVWKKLVGK